MPPEQVRLIDPALLRKVTASSFVLLKNDNQLLPLSRGRDRPAAWP